ncbi:AMP-dependent ligase [Mycolicibacterium monacense]|uniref:AMP-dependent ligase n=1 Tax=Mycolicibacterium monacense TaxID=85693 RepID=A0AAD1MY61_MYCMB|nr:AMP-dependent ligase [Mycolicibacterium monacense]
MIAASGAAHVVYVGTGGAMLPLLIFASARANVPFTPLNYRLSPEALGQLIDRLPDPLVVVDDDYRDTVTTASGRLTGSEEFLAAAGSAEPVVEFADPDDVAVVLFTSGTTSRPKAVELTHNNLTSYVTGTVEFASADPADAALVCVPPYHIAGVGAALSNLYAGRTIVYLRRFDPREWVRLVRTEKVTTATVVPTMLDRIVAVLEEEPVELPSLRNFAYGGSKVAQPLVRKALDLLPQVGFVNAYGLTETSSTIAVLTPEDHRLAHGARDEAVARRLSSVGRPVPGIEVQIRAEDGTVLGPNETGELFVRGPQVSGRYAEIGSVLDAEGWFPTRDIATLDDDGYLFIGGRSDDTIIRGGENIAPSEIEEVLVEHPHVREVVVVGMDDPEWGQIIVAVVVPEPGAEPMAEELRDFARKTLRGSRTPDRIVFRDQVPTTATGKVLRREILDDLKPATA